MNRTPRELIAMLTHTRDMSRPMLVDLAINVGEEGERVETVAVIIDGVTERIHQGRPEDVMQLRLLDELPHNATRGEP